MGLCRTQLGGALWHLVLDHREPPLPTSWRSSPSRRRSIVYFALVREEGDAGCSPQGAGAFLRFGSCVCRHWTTLKQVDLDGRGWWGSVRLWRFAGLSIVNTTPKTECREGEWDSFQFCQHQQFLLRVRSPPSISNPNRTAHGSL